MSRKHLVAGLLGLSLLPLQACATKAGTGALIGGAVGAGAGAIIGHNSGKGRNAGKGAVIGGAVGAAGGALIGNEMDKADEKKEQEPKVTETAPR